MLTFFDDELIGIRIVNGKDKMKFKECKKDIVYRVFTDNVFSLKKNSAKTISVVAATINGAKQTCGILFSESSTKMFFLSQLIRWKIRKKFYETISPFHLKP